MDSTKLKPVVSYDGWEKQFDPSARVVYHNRPSDGLPFMEVCEWTDDLGRTQSRVRIVDGSMAIALDEKTHEVYCIEIADRYAGAGSDVNVTTVEVPGGRFMKGETPLDAAKRQAKEEVGVEAVDENTDWVQLYLRHPINGPVVTDQYVFLCLHARKTAAGGGQAEGIKKVVTYPLSKLLEMEANGEFPELMMGYQVLKTQDWLQHNKPDYLT